MIFIYIWLFRTLSVDNFVDKFLIMIKTPRNIDSMWLWVKNDQFVCY